MYRTCIKAVDTFGKDTQINTAIQEMAKLSSVINRWRHGKATKDAVIEEIADSCISLVQLAYIVTDSPDFSPINNAILDKIIRLNERIFIWQQSTSTV